jgi:hypothetical protein
LSCILFTTLSFGEGRVRQIIPNYYFEKNKKSLTFALLFLNRRIVENNHEKNVSALTKEKKK